MSPAIRVAVVISLVLGVGAGADDAREILRLAARAIEAHGGWEYRFKFSGKGSLSDHLPIIVGAARILRVEDGHHAMHIEATISLPSAAPIQQPPFKVALTTDGDSIWIVPGETPTAYQSASNGAGRVMLDFLQYAVMRCLVDPGSLERAINPRLDTPDPGGPTRDIVASDAEGRIIRWSFQSSELGADPLPCAFETTDPRIDRGGSVRLQVTDLRPLDSSSISDYVIREEGGIAVVEDPAWLPPGTPAPDFALETADGESVHLSDLKGHVVVIEFWASWCGACRLSLPALEAIHQRFAGKGVRVLAVSLLERPDGDPVAYSKSVGCTFDVLLKGDAIASDYVYRGLPTFYVIAADGTVAYAGGGFHHDRVSELAEAVERALNRALQ